MTWRCHPHLVLLKARGLRPVELSTTHKLKYEFTIVNGCCTDIRKGWNQSIRLWEPGKRAPIVLRPPHFPPTTSEDHWDGYLARRRGITRLSWKQSWKTVANLLARFSGRSAGLQVNDWIPWTWYMLRLEISYIYNWNVRKYYHSRP